MRDGNEAPMTAPPSDVDYSAWQVIDQPMVDRFADAIFDHQFIHTDPERAKSGPYGGTIAHGFLSLSLLTHFSKTALPAPQDGVVELNYGFDKVRFLAPIKVGAKVRASFRLISAEAKGAGELRKFETILEIENNAKPALIAEWLVYVIAGA